MPAHPIARSVALVILVASGVLLAAEFAFRHGMWERLAKPESNAGQAIALKRALIDRGAAHVDFITLGDSRAVYGLDHDRIAKAAEASGFVHLNLSLPGMHWMSTETILRWLKGHDMKPKGVLLATNIANFQFVGNGAYEMGIAAPFSATWDSDWMAAGIPFERKQLATYSPYSALFTYREDVQDFAAHPWSRLRESARQWRKPFPPNLLTRSVRESSNVCSLPVHSLVACSEAKAGNPREATNVAQCRDLRTQAASRLDYRQSAGKRRLPHLEELSKVRREQLKGMKTDRPVIVVLTPVLKAWREQLLPVGLEDWVRDVLDPLEKRGVVEVHDYTRLFDDEPAGECSAFFDLYHQNANGQDQLIDALLPELQRVFYRSQSR